MMKLILIMIASLSMLLFSCVDKIGVSSESSPTSEPNQTQPGPPLRDENKKMRLAFLTTKAVMQRTSLTRLIKFNTDMTSLWDKTVPRVPFLQDDPIDRKFAANPPVMVVEFSPAFVSVLPSKIIQKLKESSIADGEVSIAFIAQSNYVLGEEKDHANVSTKTSLKAHGWLDPNMPDQFIGTRVNRSVSLGIFDSDYDIYYSGGVPYENLIKTPIHTHDSTLSPHSMSNKVKIGKTSPSVSFWSLAIDDEDKSLPKKAIATLHWVLNDEGSNSDYDVLKALLIAHDQPTCDDFGACLKLLKDSPRFKDSSAVAKLESLFN